MENGCRTRRTVTLGRRGCGGGTDRNISSSFTIDTLAAAICPSSRSQTSVTGDGPSNEELHSSPKGLHCSKQLSMANHSSVTKHPNPLSKYKLVACPLIEMRLYLLFAYVVPSGSMRKLMGAHDSSSATRMIICLAIFWAGYKGVQMGNDEHEHARWQPQECHRICRRNDSTFMKSSPK